MALIDGTADAKKTCAKLFLRAQLEGRIARDLPFEAREAPTDRGSTTIRVVAVDGDGIEIPDIAVYGVRTATDTTRLAPLSAQL